MENRKDIYNLWVQYTTKVNKNEKKTARDEFIVI